MPSFALWQVKGNCAYNSFIKPSFGKSALVCENKKTDKLKEINNN